jgi:hypothetical protein
VTCGAVPDAEPVVARIAPAFTLVVHDRDDHYLGPEHAEAIERWSKPPVDRWELRGKGHGTELLDAPLADRIVAHVRAHL